MIYFTFWQLFRRGRGATNTYIRNEPIIFHKHTNITFSRCVNFSRFPEQQLVKCRKECGEKSELRLHELTLSYEEQKEELQRELEMRDREVSASLFILARMAQF